MESPGGRFIMFQEGILSTIVFNHQTHATMVFFEFLEVFKGVFYSSP